INGVPVTPGQVMHQTDMNNLVFSPAAQFAGTATFTYRAVNAVPGTVIAISNEATVTITVTPPLTITWATPADILYGTALGDAQLNAVASLLGTFVYTPAAGTVLSAGANQALSVTFTPDDTVDYASASMTAS